MEKLKLWWQKRPQRDRRALTVLGLVVPVILFWYLVTVPLQDRLKMAARVLETRRAEATEVQKLLQEFVMLKGQLEGVEFKADSSVTAQLEQAFREVVASDSRPILNRTSIVIFGKSQPAAHIRLEKAQPQTFWQTCRQIASSGVYISELDLSADNKTNEFSASLKAWLPARK